MFEFKKMKKVFKDQQMQETFEKEGFIVVDFYNSKQVKDVKKLYHNLHPKDEKGFFSSILSQDIKYRETVDLELKKIGHSLFNELFTDFQIVNGFFIVKSTGEDSYLHVHQDMTVVDESEYTAISLWATTDDISDKNGVMYLLPGSHRFFPTYRGNTLPGLYDSIKEEIKDYMIPIYLKAGQAIVFDQSIIHFSVPNTSKNVRIVSNFYFTQKDAKFLVCYHDVNDTEFEGKVEVFEQDISFMTNYMQFSANVFDRPKIGRSLGLKTYNFPHLTIEQLENQFGKKRLREYTPTKKVEKTFDEEIQFKDRFKTELKEKLPFWKKTAINILRAIKLQN